MTSRQRLPNRRTSTSFEITVVGRRYRCTYSLFADGRLAEIFINNNRVNSDSDTAAEKFGGGVQHRASARRAR